MNSLKSVVTPVKLVYAPSKRSPVVSVKSLKSVGLFKTSATPVPVQFARIAERATLLQFPVASSITTGSVVSGVAFAVKALIFLFAMIILPLPQTRR